MVRDGERLKTDSRLNRNEFRRHFILFDSKKNGRSIFDRFSILFSSIRSPVFCLIISVFYFHFVSDRRRLDDWFRLVRLFRVENFRLHFNRVLEWPHAHATIINPDVDDRLAFSSYLSQLTLLYRDFGVAFFSVAFFRLSRSSFVYFV